MQEGSTRLPGAKAAQEVAVSAVWTLRFNNEADPANSTVHELLSELLGLTDESLHQVKGTIAFRVQEIVFFEGGHPALYAGSLMTK